MTGQSKLNHCYCDNGCQLSHVDIKCEQTMRKQYAKCPKKKPRWQLLKKANEVATNLVEEELDEEVELIGLANFPEVRERVFQDKVSGPMIKMNKKVEMRARKALAGKSKEEKAQMDFKKIDDVIVFRRGNRKLRA
ncbi:hypothetical protein Tco_1257729 [Tanacetum coccineum]